MTQDRRTFVSGLLWAAMAVLIWSGSLVMLRLGMTTSLNAYDLTALRFGGAAVILMPVIIRRGFAYHRLGAIGLLLLICGFGAPYIILISLALNTAPAFAAGSLNPGVMAVSSVLMGAVLFNDRIGPVRSIGIALIAAGSVFSVVLHPGGAVPGHAILIVTGCMWAAYTLTLRGAGISALHATAMVAVGSALVYLPVYVIFLPKQIATAPVRDLLMQTLFHSLLVSILALYAFNRSAELLGPVTGATLPALIPPVTLLLGLVVLREPAGIVEATTAIVIGLGVALILSGRRRACPTPKPVE